MLLSVAACYGGGSSAVSSSDYSVSGTVAAGAPYPAGTKIYFYDSAGALAASTVTLADGTYSVTLPRTSIGPFVVKTDAEALPNIVSVQYSFKSDTINIVNLTSITNLIASRLSYSGNPANLDDEVATKKVVITEAKIIEKKNEVLGVLQTVLNAADSVIDPINEQFTANSTGHDLALDALNISIVPSSSISANVEVSVRNAIQDGEAPKSIKFISGTNSTTPTALPSVSKADMPKAGISIKLADLITRINSCFKLTKAERATSTTAASVTGDCRLMFYNNDPTLYKNNGYQVGNNASLSSVETAFSGLFTSNESGSTAIKYSNPVYKYTVKTSNTDPLKPLNGDVNFLVSWQANDGSSDNFELIAREDSSGNLGLIGNLSSFDVQINPWMEYKEYTHDNYKNYSYLNSGYSIAISTLLTDSASASFVLAKVTPPDGAPLFFTRKSALSYWIISTRDPSVNTAPVGWRQTNTAGLTLNGSFVTANSSTSPRVIDTNRFFALDANGNTKDWTDTEIAAISQQGNWRVDFYTSLLADTTQDSVNYVYRRTVDRARTISELGLVTWPTLTSAYRAMIKTQSNTYGGINIPTNAKFIVAENGNDAWTVPSNAIAPNLVKIYGSQTLKQSIIFDDSVQFLSSSRTATVSCNLKSNSDTHCGLNGTIKANVTFVGIIQFRGYDKNRVTNYYSIDMRKN